MPKLLLLFFLAALVASLSLPFSVLTALLVIAAVALGSRAAVFWRPNWGWDGVVLVWLLWVPLSLYWSLSIGLGMQWAGTLLPFPLAYIGWRHVASDPRAEAWLQWLLWLLLPFLALWGIFQGPETFTAKPQGPFNDPNTYAGVLNLLSVPLLAQYLTLDLAGEPRWRRTIQLAAIGIGALAFFLVASRGATLALVLVLIPLLWFARRQGGYYPKLLALLIVASVAYFFADWATSGTRNVLLRLVVTLQDGDSSRVMLMRSALAMIADNPWLGSGLGSFRLLYPRYRMVGETGTGGGWAHNDYLQLWQEAGLPMLAVIICLVVWVGREIWSVAREKCVSGTALVKLGYLLGVTAVLIQAATNFMLYFAFVSMVLGLYLGRVRPALSAPSTAALAPRAWRMSVTAYGAILIYLFAGQVAVELLLDRASPAMRLITKAASSTSRYEIAYWLSVLAPFNHAPPQVMGQELAHMLAIGQGTRGWKTEMFEEAVENMETSQRLAPCYMPFGTEALSLLVRYGETATHFEKGIKQAKKNLLCNPRHGASYYLYGRLMDKFGHQAAAMDIWKSGLGKVVFAGDRLMLATAVMAHTSPGHEAELEGLADKMVGVAHYMETYPNAQLDQEFWTLAQYQMLRANESGYMKWVLGRE